MRGSLAAREAPRISLRFIRATSYLLFALLLCLPVAAQTPQDIQQTANEAIRRLDLQTELAHQPEPPHFSIKLPSEVLWVVTALAIGMLLYAFRDMLPILWRRPGGAWTSDEVVAGDVQARAPDAVLGAADDLAAQGRFVEAMHVLLLQGLADIRARLDEKFADSFTSREILRSTKLSEAGQSSLRDIINRVEWTYFGEHPAKQADYVACRMSFSALARALHGSAPSGSALNNSAAA